MTEVVHIPDIEVTLQKIIRDSTKTLFLAQRLLRYIQQLKEEGRL